MGVCGSAGRQAQGGQQSLIRLPHECSVIVMLLGGGLSVMLVLLTAHATVTRGGSSVVLWRQDMWPCAAVEGVKLRVGNICIAVMVDLMYCQLKLTPSHTFTRVLPETKNSVTGVNFKLAR